MVDIATLGIKVDSSGATKASTDLEKLSVSAKDASKSVDQLGASSTKAGAQVQTNSQRIAQAVQQNTALETSTKRLGVAHENLGHHAHVVESGLHSMGAAAGAQVGPLFGLSATTVRAAASMQEFEFKSSQLRTGLRLLRPLATEAGGSLGHLGLLAGAARGGLVALAAVVVGTALIALEKAADGVTALKERLGELSRSPAAGDKVFHQLEDAAKKAGSGVEELATSYEILKKAQREALSNKGFVMAPGADMDSFFGFAPKEAIRAVDTLNELLKISKVPAAEAKTAMDDFFRSVVKGGGLTKDIFDKLEDASPRAARAIQEAFSFTDIEGFRKKLDYGPIAVEKLIKSLARIGPAVDEELKNMPKDVTQSLDTLKADFNRLMADIGASGGSKLASNFLQTASMLIKADWNWSDILKFDDATREQWNPWKDLNKWDAEATSKIFSWYRDTMRGIQAETEAFWSKFWSSFGKSPDMGPSAQGDSAFQDRLVQKYRGSAGLEPLVPAITATDDALNKMTADVVGDAAKIAEAARIVSESAAKVGAASSDYGNSTGISVGSNATGGIYKMPGAGISDSIRLSGRVSPGETVAIIPADKMSGSLLAQLHDTISQSPINIGPGGSSYISAPSSYSAQEARAGKLAMNVTAAQQAQARARIAANVMSTSGGTASGFGGGGSGVGGGGFGGPSAFKEWPDRGGDVNPNAGYGGAINAAVARANIARKAYGTAAPLQKLNAPASRSVDGLSSPAGWADYFAATNAAMSAPFDLGGVNSFDQSPSSQYFDPYSAYDPYGAYTDQYGATYSAPDYSSFSWDGGPLPGDTSGSLFSDLGGPDIYAGAFARGGSFRVPNRGRGGVDGTSVGMRVTPGETVSVESNEERIGGDKKAAGGTHIENINIVTPGHNPMASLSRNAIRRELSAWMR